MGATAPAGEAARRWRALVRARRREVERLDPGRPGPSDARYWDARARKLAARALGTAAGDPFLARLRRLSGARTTVLDVGAGPGRFSLALAPRVAGVVAVDPSPRMLALVATAARRAGLANVATVEGRWEDVEVAPADVAFASYVLPVVDDAPRFLAHLDAAARRHALLYLGAFTADAVTDPLWRHFHGRPRAPGPTWLDAADVLDEMGIRASVEVVEVPVRTRFHSLAEAVADYRDLLAVPDDAPTRAELRRLLRWWLVGPPGALRPPVATLPAAVVRWRPSGG
ncbi:MAG: class I SAM-dependent methyltransferase [Acidimicrobiales bacterium]